MAKLTANGVTMRAHTLFTASARAVAALQRETGMKLQALIERAKDDTQSDHEVWALKATEYLSEQTRGNLLTWDQVWDRPLPVFVPEPGDVAQRDDEAGDSPVPTRAGTGTPAPDAPAVPADAQPTPTTPRSPRSSGKSRGSKGKSARDS